MKERILSFFRLTRYELRKAFGTVWMAVFLAALVLANGWRLYDSYHQKVARWEDYPQVYQECYAYLSGSITTDKINSLMTVYGPLQKKFPDLSREYDPNAYTYSEDEDYSFFRELFYERIYYDYLYQNHAVQITDQARELAALYQELGNPYDAARNEILAQDFAGRKIPLFGDTRHYEVLLNYDFSAMLVLVLCLFALCGMFVTEKETGMYMLHRTTLLGGPATVGAKFAASAFFSIAVSVLFFTQDFLTLHLLGQRWEALSDPVYVLWQLEYTPLRMSLGTAFLALGAVKTLGVLCCSCFFLLVSCLVKRVLSSFIVSMALLFGAVAAQNLGVVGYPGKWCNPMELVIARELFAQDDFVNLFGHPVRYFLTMILSVVLTAAVVCLVILYRNRSTRAGLLERRRRNVSV